MQQKGTFDMEDHKQDIINRIMMLDKNIDAVSYQQHLRIILNPYKIDKESYEMTLYEGDANEKILKRFLISKTVAGCTKRTVRSYKNYLENFAMAVNKPLTAVCSDDIRLYIAEKAINDKVSRESQRNIHRAISSFYAWAQREEIVLKNPILKIDCPKKEKVKKHAFTDTEIEIMRKNLQGLREKAIFEVMLSTWCRVSELEGMDRTSIEQDGSILVMGKGQKERRVFLNAKAKVALEDYINSRNDNNIAMFVSNDSPHERLRASRIEVICRELGYRSSVKPCHPHRFRRTGATIALRAGMPIQDVSKILGHESIETTQIYLDIDEREILRSHEKYVR